MRFFSNDSDDARDQSNVDVQTRNEQINDDQAHGDVNPDHVQSDPVAVPQQRSGSPWSDAPGTAADDEADRSDNSDTVDSVDADRGDRADHETSDAVDLPLDDKDTDVNTDTVRDTDDSVHDDTAPDDTAALTTTTYGPDGTVVTNDETDAGTDAGLDKEFGFDDDSWRRPGSTVDISPVSPMSPDSPYEIGVAGVARRVTRMEGDVGMAF